MNKNSTGGIKMKEGHIKLIISGISLVVGIFIISIVVGFFAGREEENQEHQKIEVNHITGEVSEAADTKAPEIVSYYLINEEDGELRLYYVEGENSVRLRSEEISKEIFPKEDMVMLSEGIKTDTSEEALEVWENFIS